MISLLPHIPVESILMNKFAALLLLLAPGSAMAAVADSSAAGFTVKQTYTIKASPGDVYGGLVHHIGEWWNPEHTYSHDGRNLSIEEKPMGCFCEKLPNNGWVRHMEVVFLAPAKMLVMSGGLGPLQSNRRGGQHDHSAFCRRWRDKIDRFIYCGGLCASGHEYLGRACGRGFNRF